MPHRKLEAVKSAPRRTKDTDCTVRPRLARQPRDDFFTITELLFGILAIGRVPFTLPRAANIHARTHIASIAVAHVLVLIIAIIDGREQSSLSTLFRELLFRFPAAHAETDNRNLWYRYVGSTPCATLVPGLEVVPENRSIQCRTPIPD